MYRQETEASSQPRAIEQIEQRAPTASQERPSMNDALRYHQDFQSVSSQDASSSAGPQTARLEERRVDLLGEGQDTIGESSEVRSRTPAHREESQGHFFHDSANLSQPEKDIPSSSKRRKTDQEEKRKVILVKPQRDDEMPLKSAILAEIGQQLSYDHLLTAQGQYFLSTNLGSHWLASDRGRAYLSDHAHDWLKTGPGEQWYQEKGSQWLASEDGRRYLRRHAHDWLQTESGARWYQEKGSDWLASEKKRRLEAKEKHQAAMKAAYARPEVKEKRKAAMEEAYARLEVKEKRKAAMKAYLDKLAKEQREEFGAEDLIAANSAASQAIGGGKSYAWMKAGKAARQGEEARGRVERREGERTPTGERRMDTRSNLGQKNAVERVE